MKKILRLCVLLFLMTASACLTASAAYSSGTISYHVEPGALVRFSRSDFADFFDDRDNGGDALRYVTFRTNASLKASSGAVYYDFDGDREQDFTRDDLGDHTFYYASESHGDYPLDELSFAASTRGGGQTVTLGFTAHGSIKQYSGTLRIQIGSTEDSETQAAVSYSLTAGESVDFQRSDFRNAASDVLNGTLRYVTFYTDDVLSENAGGLYADYGKSTEFAFTRNNLQNYTFYDSASAYGDYAVGTLTFAAPRNAAARTVTLHCTFYDSRENFAVGTVEIRIAERSSSSQSSGSSTGTSRTGSTSGSAGTGSTASPGATAVPPSSGQTGTAETAGTAAPVTGDIQYTVNPGGTVSFRSADFNTFYQKATGSAGPIRYVTMETSADLSATETGLLWSGYGQSGAVSFDKSRLQSYRFYFSDAADGNYPLSGLTFAASGRFSQPLSIRFTAWYSSTRRASGTLVIRLSAVPASVSGELSAPASSGTAPAASRPAAVPASSGSVPAAAPASSGSAPAAAPSAPGASSVTPTSSGSVSTQPAPAASPAVPTVSDLTGSNIRYTASYTAPVRFNAGDFDRFFRARFPDGQLSSVRLLGLPASGTVYYNYYNTSSYGTGQRLQVTDSVRSSMEFFYRPASSSQYALSELAFVPVSGVNTCVTIPFSAAGTTAGSSAGQILTGTILISATASAVSEVYGVAAKGSPVSFPADSIDAAVKSATGTAPSGIRLLSLPPASTGTLYQDTADTPASTAQTYAGSGGFLSVARLRFVPSADFTGSVEIPYAAVNERGNAYAAGTFCVGIVNTVRRFRDLPASSWCFKYVTELADSGVVGGYPDGSYQPDNPVTRGAALKLVMLASGYTEQPSTAADPFSTYLSKARADGLVSGMFNLNGYITRMEAARLAAAALKLRTDGVPKVFTDTEDAAVMALNAAGIINGYFENGISTFRPDNTLTRGQMAAIVWRIRNYRA